MFKRGMVCTAVVAGLMVVSTAFYASGQQAPKHESAAKSDGKTLVVQLCDGKTNVAVRGVAPGERLTSDQARTVSAELMRKWMASQNATVAEAWAHEANVSTTAPTSQAKGSAPSALGDANEQPIDFSP